MTVSRRLAEAAEPLLLGDESMQAAQQLEAVILDEYLGDPAVESLSEALALYAPGSSNPYVGPDELRKVIQTTLDSLGAE